MRGCVLRLSGMLVALFVWGLIRAIWYILLVYVYAILTLCVGLRQSVALITENVCRKAATQWGVDFRLQQLLRQVVPPLAYVTIALCWIFTAGFTYFLLKWLVWR